MSNAEQQSRNLRTNPLSRRNFLTYASGLGLTSTVMSGALWAKVAEDTDVPVTKAMLQEAEHLAGLTFTDIERDLMVEGLNSYLKKYRAFREVPLDNAVAPAVQFNPVVAGMTFDKKEKRLKMSERQPRNLPSDLEAVAFWPVLIWPS